MAGSFKRFKPGTPDLGEGLKAWDVNLKTEAQGTVQFSTSVFSEPLDPFTGYTCLNEILQGYDNYKRIGSKIVMKRIHLRFVLAVASTAVLYASRVWLYYDRQTNRGAPGLYDIFNFNGVGWVNFSTPVFWSNRNRFVPLFDKTVVLGNGSGEQISFDEHFECELETNYQSSGGTIYDISTGSLLFGCGFASGTVNLPFIQGFCSRIEYYDK